METVPLNQDQKNKIMSLPTLSEHLPYAFYDGNGIIDHLSLDCAKCGALIMPDNIKGQFEANKHGMATIEGYGMCHNCRTFTPVAAKFSSDGTYLVNEGSGWTKKKWGKGVAPWRLDLLLKWKKHLVPAAISAIISGLWLYFHRG